MEKKFFDIGVNFFNHQFENRIDDIIIAAKKNHVSHMIAIGSHFINIEKNIELCKSHDGIYTTYGLHPHYAKNILEFTDKTSHFFHKYHQNKIVAIGEIGLDFDRNLSSKKEQIYTLEYFLDIAEKNNELPIYLHEREAHIELLSVMRNFKLENKKVVHCYTSDKNNLKNYLDLNCYIGITGWLTNEKKNLDLLDAIHVIPQNNIMIETDSPYLKPRNFKTRSNINEPSYISYIFDYLSQKLNIEDIEKFNDKIFQNSIDFFNIKKA